MGALRHRIPDALRRRRDGGGQELRRRAPVLPGHRRAGPPGRGQGRVRLTVLHTARGRADRPVPVHRHDVQIGHGEGLHVGTELLVDDVQQFLGLRHHVGQVLLIRPAPRAGDLVGHGQELHVVPDQSAHERLLGEPEHVLEAQIGLHVLLEDLGDLVDRPHVLEVQHIAQDRLQEVLLELHPAVVADAAVPLAVAVRTVVVVGPPADDLHGVLAHHEPPALFLFDHQVLFRVVVVHGIGIVEPDAPDRVHHLPHGLPFHDHPEVRLEAHQLGDLLIDLLHPPFPAAVHAVDGVELLHVPVHVYHGVPGQGHDRGPLMGHVVAGQEHGVGIAAAVGVAAQDQDRVIVLALAGPLAPGPDARAVAVILRPGIGGLLGPLVHRPRGHGALVDGDRPHEQAPPDRHRQDQHQQRQDHQQQDQSPPGDPPSRTPLVQIGQAVPLPLSFPSHHPFHLYPLNKSLSASRASRVARWTVSPRSSSSRTVPSSPSRRARSRSSSLAARSPSTPGNLRDGSM